MQKLSIRKFSLLGLVLLAASAVTAAFLPKNDSARIADGVAVDSTGGDGNQKSCVNVAGTKNCTLTVSATTEVGNTSANTHSSGGKHSSISPS